MWSRPLSGFAKQVERDLSGRQKEMTLYALQQLIMHSPVDTGAYRGSHFVTVGRRNHTRVPEHGQDGARPEAEMLLASDSQPFKVVYIQSNIVYGESLENGHSQQAPSGVYSVAHNSTRERFS